MNTSMNFISFTEAIVENLQNRLGEEYRVFASRIKKNNGIELTGIIVEEKQCNTSPAIYINDLYKEYREGKGLTEIEETVYHIYSKNRFSKSVNLARFFNFKESKNQLAFKLIHLEKNKELLKEVPHKIQFNLAVVFYYIVTEPPFCGKAEILIHNSHLQLWGIDKEQLYETAIKNTPKLFPAEISGIADLIKEFSEDSTMDRQELERKIPMFVLTNKQKLQGAGCMFYPDVLKKFSEKVQSDVYILPSSIHEVILVPVSEKDSKEKLLEMVTEINATQVDEEEVLADAIYLYQREKDEIIRLC